MKRYLIAVLAVLAACLSIPCLAAPTNDTLGQTVETIVCIRHGEKPRGGLGQLTCKGLNRALALPDILLSKYGTPQFIFAPNPTQKVDAGRYYYVRPIATIEPTAIRCGLPIDTQFGYREIAGLENELEEPKYQNAVVFVAWEHGYLDIFAKDMLASNGGHASRVPKWPEDDYDTIFLIKITRSNGTHTVSFEIDHERLNGRLKDSCP